MGSRFRGNDGKEKKGMTEKKEKGMTAGEMKRNDGKNK